MLTTSVINQKKNYTNPSARSLNVQYDTPRVTACTIIQQQKKQQQQQK